MIQTSYNQHTTLVQIPRRSSTQLVHILYLSCLMHSSYKALHKSWYTSYTHVMQISHASDASLTQILSNIYTMFLFTNITQCVNESHAKPYNCWTNILQIPIETPYESYKKLTQTFIRILYKSHTHIIQMLYKSRYNPYVTHKQTLYTSEANTAHILYKFYTTFIQFCLRIWYTSLYNSQTSHYKSHQTRGNLVQSLKKSYK